MRRHIQSFAISLKSPWMHTLVCLHQIGWSLKMQEMNLTESRSTVVVTYLRIG